jgi:3-methyladenine DNA glycosylase AlkD
VNLVNSELEQYVDGGLEDAMKSFDANGVTWRQIGLRTPDVRRAASRSLTALKRAGFSTIDSVLEAAGQLLSTRGVELRTVAFQWARSFGDTYETKHFEIFRIWLEEYVTGWGSCDDLCVGALGIFLYRFPQFVSEVKTWTRSEKPMTRRAAPVSLIYSLRRGELGEHCYEIADQLLNDEHYLVLKGYGWMLKEATKHFQNKVFEYVMEHRHNMPRLALRYAIEKMPENLRKEATKK